VMMISQTSFFGFFFFSFGNFRYVTSLFSLDRSTNNKNERCHALCFPRHRADEDDRFLQQVRPFVSFLSIIIALESLFISLLLRSYPFSFGV